jgi:iron complex outermembrane recepter protein
MLVTTRAQVPRAHVLLASALLMLCATTGARAEESPPSELTGMSLADLSKVQVTSVSKASETLQRAPAAVYVISHEDIARSGATSVPEALRLAPNLLVTQTTSSAYVISARGFGGNPTAQNFSNKLLILIDGRSVYTPLYSGIYANTLDVLLEDIDRIEVISGVGATLWGANAMNGVINIITRSSYLTQGTFADLGAGTQEQLLGVRYGDRLNDDATYRVYGFGFHRAALELPDNSSAHDGWSKGQAGFRGDWASDQDSWTMQGDFYRGTENNPGTFDSSLLGGNLLTRYQHHGARSDLQVQAYFDQTQQFGPEGGTGFVVHTYDLELQQAIVAGSWNRIMWGAGERVWTYGITNTPTFLFEPPQRSLNLADIFIQDTMSITNSLSVSLGVKFEDDPYAGWSTLPDIRASWALSERSTLWAAASRAIRSPTPFDSDVIEKLGTTTYLVANRQFQPEKVTAYELGSRSQPTDDISLAISAFYNVYEELRTVEPASASVFLPLYWGNYLRGDTYGIDAWGNWQVTQWWRLSPGVSWVHEQFSFAPGASALLGVDQHTDDPSSHATLASAMNLPEHITFDVSVRYVGALPDPPQSHYWDMDARLAWQPSNKLELSVRGAHLLHERHYEFPTPNGEQVLRSVIAEARLKF